MLKLIDDMRAQWRELDGRIADLDEEFAERARTDEVTRRRPTILVKNGL